MGNGHAVNSVKSRAGSVATGCLPVPIANDVAKLPNASTVLEKTPLTIYLMLGVSRLVGESLASKILFSR